jgi:putative tricarboxylic transport membrane protein
VSSGADITPLRRLQATLPYVVVLAAGLFLYHQADNFEFEQVSGRIGPGAWPKLILALMLATALWGIVASALKPGNGAAAEDAEAEAAEDIVRPPEIYPYRVWFAVGATLLYLLALPLIGFFVATVIYSFGLMYLGHFRRPVAITLLSVAIALAFMFVFMRVVYVALPLGIAPFDQVSYALMAVMGVH